jgi:hypothetical protein
MSTLWAMSHGLPLHEPQACPSAKQMSFLLLSWPLHLPFSSFCFVAPCKILMAFHDAQPGLRVGEHCNRIVNDRILL